MNRVVLLMVWMLFFSGCVSGINKEYFLYPIGEYPPNTDVMRNTCMILKIQLKPEREFEYSTQLKNGIDKYFRKYTPGWSDNLIYDFETELDLSDDSHRLDLIEVSINIREGMSASTHLTNVRTGEKYIVKKVHISHSSGSVSAYNLGLLIGKGIVNTLATDRSLITNSVESNRKLKDFKRLLYEKQQLLEEQQEAERARKLLPEVSEKETRKRYNNLVKSNDINELAASIEAYRSAISNGYKPTHLPTFGTPLIVLDEIKTSLFPVRSEDLPLEPTLMDRKELRKILGKAEKVILLQPLQSTAKRDMLSQSKVQSEYISGHREQHNPAYDSARRDYQRALNEYNRVQAQISNQSSAGSLLWVQIATNTALRLSVSNALDNAKQRLARTPQTISIPIKKSYSYNAMEVQVSKGINYKLFIIDIIRKKVTSKKFSRSEDKTFRLQYDKHSEDTGYTTYDTEEDVEAYEKKTPTFSVDSIVNELATTPVKEFKSGPFTSSLSFIKNPKTKKRKLQKPEAANSKLSGLLQSVVAIQDNGGSTIGTGFFIRKNLILTNRHVVEERKLISVKTKGGQKYVGNVLDVHYDLDVALVEIDGSGTPVKIYSGTSATEGEEVIAVGNPIGLEYSVTKGIISSIRKRKNKERPLSKEYRYIQTDVAINPGNSGGPLFMGGKLVGINTSKMVNEDIEGIGFAIHYDEILRYLDDNDVKVEKEKSKLVAKPVKKKGKELPEDKVERKLTKLKKLYDKGLITEDEYKRERAEVLETF